MSVGFGFSVGDFLATINLVDTVINALRESSHSTAAFRELLKELYTLEKALINVKHIELDESQHFEKIALYQAAAQCQRSIDAFWNKVKIYQPHLSQGGTSSRFKDGWMKIKWAVCKKGDVEDFRTEIQAHVSSIQVLMGAIQLNASARNAQNQQTQYKSLAGSIQEFSSRAIGKLHAVANGVARNVRQSNRLLHICAEILQTNLRVFQMIYDIQLFITHIPGQVNRQQPVYMVDAFNKESPFHLEFVRSAEALLAILKVNFKETGCGPDMIDRGEFVIEEAGTHNVIDLTRDWETCFYPGQRVAMSMIFRKTEQRSAKSSCPRCETKHCNSTEEETTCSHCGIVYRQLDGVLDANQQHPILPNGIIYHANHLHQRYYRWREVGIGGKSTEDGDDASFMKFRRLRILTGILGNALNSTFLTHKLSRYSLDDFLRRKFSPSDYYIRTRRGDVEFWIPRQLTKEERLELSSTRYSTESFWAQRH